MWWSQRGRKWRHNMAHTLCNLDKQGYTPTHAQVPQHSHTHTHTHTQTNILIALCSNFYAKASSYYVIRALRLVLFQHAAVCYVCQSLVSLHCHIFRVFPQLEKVLFSRIFSSAIQCKQLHSTSHYSIRQYLRIGKFTLPVQFFLFFFCFNVVAKLSEPHLTNMTAFSSPAFRDNIKSEYVNLHRQSVKKFWYI